MGINMRFAIDQLLRTDLNAMIHRTFQTVAPADHYLDNWHMAAMAYVLSQAAERNIKRLIISIPPRSGKSIATSVAFPAWLLGRYPTSQIICASYSKELANKHSRDCRAVMQSDWYKRAFPYTVIDPTKNTEDMFSTIERGFRMATSVGGTLTGLGADFLIVDDSLKPDDAYSEAARNGVNQWFSNTLLSRLNDKRNGVIVMNQQRVHDNDLIGNQLERDPDGWHQLTLPAIALAPESVQIGLGLFHNRVEGEVLHPEREPLEQLERMQKAMGTAAFSAQYLQSPTPPDGAMIKASWFGRYTDHDRPDRFEQIVQSWDTANKVTELSDYSVCTTWGIFRNKLYLLHVLRQRLEYPDLKRAVRDQAQLFGAKTVLIEDNASGTQLIQDLLREGVHGVTGRKPNGEKVFRMRGQTATIEAGFVYLPAEAPWLDNYLREIMIFPGGKHDDQVDSTSQFLEWYQQPMAYEGIFLYYKMMYEKKMRGEDD